MSFVWNGINLSATVWSPLKISFILPWVLQGSSDILPWWVPVTPPEVNVQCESHHHNSNVVTVLVSQSPMCHLHHAHVPGRAFLPPPACSVWPLPPQSCFAHDKQPKPPYPTTACLQCSQCLFQLTPTFHPSKGIQTVPPASTVAVPGIRKPNLLCRKRLSEMARFTQSWAETGKKARTGSQEHQALRLCPFNRKITPCDPSSHRHFYLLPLLGANSFPTLGCVIQDNHLLPFIYWMLVGLGLFLFFFFPFLYNLQVLIQMKYFYIHPKKFNIKYTAFKNILM